MARYRVGDTYLSEQEYEEHFSSMWTVFLVIVGSIASTVACYYFVISAPHFAAGWGHGARFSLLFAALFLGGGLAYLMRKVLKTLITVLFGLAVIGGVIYFIGMLLWKVT